ncbi:hypothetical protein [Deinococcus pimensis]|uniref:hypothetical protein n=1 Tax=Deinococcus pimensis TaxID=309888 RepID=UPI000481C375|nr:hypothetical protein [Deinococcus pimensis]
MPATLPQAPTPAGRPLNYWLGFWLTWFFPGAGHTYINRPGWHAAWLGIVIFLSLLGNTYQAAPALGITALVAQVVLLVVRLTHYRSLYARQFTPGTPVTGIKEGLKWGLVSVHAGLGSAAVLSMVAAVLIPNLMVVGVSAEEQSHRDFARGVFGAAVQQHALRGPITTGSCVTRLQNMLLAPPNDLVSCEVTTDAEENSTIRMRFKNGDVFVRPGL